MELYPAIDLMSGQCVRLKQGRFESSQTYSANPVEMAKHLVSSGAKHLHVVDLDGARNPNDRQIATIEAICQTATVPVQVGGGVGSADDVAELLGMGAKRVIVGSLAAKDPECTRQLLDDFGGDALTIALDVEIVDGEPWVKVNGWQERSKHTVSSLLEYYLPYRPTILCTDISRDGLMKGPHTEFYRRLVQGYPNAMWLASGGVASLQDLKDLKAAGVSGAIVGKALYEKRFTVSAALELLESSRGAEC